MEIVFPTNTTEVIDAIRGVIGRDVTFVRKLSVPCSACTLDPITNTSTNSFCVVCSGEGYVITYSGITVSAHVTHAPAETLQWIAGGQLPIGDLRLQIKYTSDNITMVDLSDHVLVDSNKYDIRSRIYRGVRELNRILIDLIQRVD